MLIIEHMASITDAVVLTVFLGMMFGYRRDRKNLAVFFVVLQYIVAQYLSSAVLLQNAVMIGINIAFCVVCLDGRIHTKCIWSVAAMAVIAVINVVMIPLLSMILQKPLSEFIVTGYMVRVLFIVICQLLHMLCFSCILVFLKKGIFLKKTEWLLVILIFAVNTFIMLGIMEINIELQLSDEMQGMVLAFTFLILFVFAGYIYMVYRINVMNQEAVKAQLIIMQLEDQKEMIKEVHKMQTEINIMRHDMKHYVTLWLSLMQSGNAGQAQKQMQSYISQMEQMLVNVNYIQGNECINAILFNKNQRCKELNIPVSYEITTNFDKEKESDIAIILSNLLDNAIRAEEHMEEKRISLQIFKYNEIRQLIVSNSIDKPLLKENPELMTTKKDKDNHGFGLLSVKSIVKKLGGSIDISDDDGEFVIHISGI